MPELKKVLVVGAGFAGMACAIQARRSNPECEINILEKQDSALSWIDRKGLDFYPLASLLEPVNPYPDWPEKWIFQKRLLQGWETEQLAELPGIDLDKSSVSQLVCRDLKHFRHALLDILGSMQVNLRLAFAVESVSTQPDGSFRVWSRDGDAFQADRIILATGGERNHGLRIASDFGADIIPPLPAFVRLKLASPKAGDRMGPIERHVRVRCLKSGTIAGGLMKLSSRGMEGPCISSLSATQCALWHKLHYMLQLEVDWLPEQSGASILKEMVSRSEIGGKRTVAQTPLFGFVERSWHALLKSAKIDGETTWSRMKMKKLQALANRIKADPIVTNGMGLPEDERAWSGGVSLASVNQQSLEGLTSPGIYYAGEILDLHGLPGGDHQNLIWATAWLAGQAAVKTD